MIFLDSFWSKCAAAVTYICQTYSLRRTKTVRLAFKFGPTKIVHVDCSKVHLIKAISNTKKELHWEGHGANNQMFK